MNDKHHESRPSIETRDSWWVRFLRRVAGVKPPRLRYAGVGPFSGINVRVPYISPDGRLYTRTYVQGLRTTLRGALVREELPWTDWRWDG